MGTPTRVPVAPDTTTAVAETPLSAHVPDALEAEVGGAKLSKDDDDEDDEDDNRERSSWRR